jgi:hypothetical protein
MEMVRMTTRRPIVVLTVLLAGAPATEAQIVVGYAVGPRQRVLGGVPPEKKPLEESSPIRLGSRVATGRRGRTTVALGAHPPKEEGFVRIGPDTETVFAQFLIEGQPPVMGLRMAFGMIRLAFMPEGLEPGAGEYWVELPGKDRLRLLGTDVYVRVNRRDQSADVAVVEGRVVLESRTGVTVVLGPGQWIHVPVDGPPSPPAIWGPVQDDGPFPPGPDELLPVDPPQLRNLRFDLPR